MVLLNVLPVHGVCEIKVATSKNTCPVQSIVCMILLPQCSYCHKDDCIDDAVQDKRFCLSETENGIELKKSHTYHSR